MMTTDNMKGWSRGIKDIRESAAALVVLSSYNMAWLKEDADRRGITVVENLNLALTSFRTMRQAGIGVEGLDYALLKVTDEAMQIIENGSQEKG